MDDQQEPTETRNVPMDGRDSALTYLDEQLDRLNKTIELVYQRLTPVLSRCDSEKAEPRPEPSSELRARGERLRELNSRLDSLLRELDI